MKKSTMMAAVVMMVSLFTMGTIYAQCCGAKKGDSKKKTAVKCPMTQKTITKADVEKMMKKCPMMKGKTAEEQKKIMASCPMMKFIKKGGDTKKLSKDQLQTMMKSCPMMKKPKSKCKMIKCIPIKGAKGKCQIKKTSKDKAKGVKLEDAPKKK